MGLPAAAEPNRQPSLVDYVVRRGDTLTTIARRLYGSSGRMDLILKYNPLPPKVALREGQVLHVPAEVGPDAYLTYVRNLVDAYTPDRHPGRKDDELRRGHKVATLDSSAAEISFSDETHVQLGERSLLLVAGDAPSTPRARSAADTTLLSGSLRAHLSELAGRPQSAPLPILQTPAARVRLAQGTGLLDVDPQRTTRVSVHRGQWRVAAAGADVKVQEGFGTRVDPGRRPNRPRRLPASPAWVEAPAPIVLWTGKSVTVAAHYTPGPPGVAPVVLWHLEVARDERFNDMVLDQKVPVQETELRAANLGPGTYYARVAGIDNDQMVGTPGGVARFVVAPLRIQGATEGKTAKLQLPEGLLCEVDGAAVAGAEPVSLSPARAHTVRCSVEGSSSDAIIPASQCGPVLAESSAGVATIAGNTGRRTVVLRLRDGAGQPLAHTAVRVRATAGVTVGPLAEAPEGTFTAEVTWPLGQDGLTLHYDIGPEDDAQSHEIILPRAVLPVAPRPIAPLPPPRTERRFELTPLLGAHLGNFGQGSFGGGAGVEGALRVLPPTGLFTVGLRLFAEHAAFYGGGRTACVADEASGRRCLPGAMGTYADLRGRDLLTLSLPLNYRLRGPQATWSPYLVLAPQLHLSFLQTSVLAQPNPLLVRVQPGVLGMAGIELRTHTRGALFLELGYRLVLPEPPAADNAPLSGAQLYSGYRISL